MGKGKRGGGHHAIVLTGHTLTIDEVVRVARHGNPVTLDGGALERMRRCRRVVEAALERGDSVYGLTTGVGVLKRMGVSMEEHGFDRRMVESHRVGQGPPAPTDVTRATMLCLANGLASGTAGVRPVVVDRLLSALNEGTVPPVRLLGSIGMADLAPMADLAAGALGDLPLAPGEGLALINNNAFTTAYAALAVHDAETLLGAMAPRAPSASKALPPIPAPWTHSWPRLAPTPA